MPKKNQHHNNFSKKDYFDYLLTLTPSSVYWKDLNGIYLGCNLSMLEMVGLSSIREIIGRTDYDLPWKESARILRKNDQEVIKSKKLQSFEETGKLSNGNTVTVICNKMPLVNKSGEIIGIIGSSIDISRLKKTEIDLKISKEAAEVANKAKSEFIRNMSHDLRTPLAGIIGISSIQAQEGTDDQDRKFGEWVHGAGEELLELLNSVLEVTAAEHPVEVIKQEKINLSKLAEELYALMLPAIESKALQFELKLDANLPLIISDRSKLKRILLNLLSNAVKFTKKGKISLEIGLLELENNQAQIEMHIIDTGIGIAKDNLDKLFDRFYRAHPSYSAEYKGYGIGLYLVKKAMELLGGQINVSSEEGKGSCFTLNFTFPLAEESVKKTISKPIDHIPKIDKVKKLKETVLIAEDNDLVLYAVKNTLIKLGYKVTTVSEGKAALEALKNRRFSWVLLDIGLPDLDGSEVTRLYRKWEQENNKSHLPIFALTAHAEDEVIEKYKKMGIDRVLTKPFTEKHINTIKKFIAK